MKGDKARKSMMKQSVPRAWRAYVSGATWTAGTSTLTIHNFNAKDIDVGITGTGGSQGTQGTQGITGTQGAIGAQGT